MLSLFATLLRSNRLKIYLQQKQLGKSNKYLVFCQLMNVIAFCAQGDRDAGSSQPRWARLNSRAHRVYRHSGGESGIRTHDKVAPIPVFETGAFVRSAISPRGSHILFSIRQECHALDHQFSARRRVGII